MQLCTTHSKINAFTKIPDVDAVAQVKRVYDNGQFKIMFCCADCLSHVRRQAAQYGFDIDVDAFNRRSTDELKKDGVLI